MDFEAELMDLIDRAIADGVERDDIVSALELRLMALKEEQSAEPGLEAGDGSEASRAKDD